MKVKKFENLGNENCFAGSKWSSLNALGTQTPLTHPHLQSSFSHFLNQGVKHVSVHLLRRTISSNKRRTAARGAVDANLGVKYWESTLDTDVYEIGKIKLHHMQLNQLDLFV